MQTKKFNIVQLIDSLAAGGAEMMAVNIANGLAEDENFVSHLVVTRKEGELKNKVSKNVQYLFLNKKGSIDIKALLKFKKYIQQNNIGVMHAHSSSFFYGALMKMMLPHLKLIWHDHYGKSENVGERPIFALRFFSKYFNIIISVNSILKEWAIKNLKCKNVVYVENFAELNYKEKKTFLNGIEGKRIVCIAGYRPQKNHLNLLRAFKQVVEKHPDWSLHLVGKGYEDAYHHQINNFISENRLEQSVFQYGVCTDIGNILSQCEIGVLSSDSEGLPISLLEYGLAGLAVVVTNVGECANVLENGKQGLIVQPNNSEELAEKILLLVEDKEIRNTFGKSLLHQVDINYSKNSFLKKLKKIY